MVFCNKKEDRDIKSYDCHNPYFNRWFSAIIDILRLLLRLYGHNPYFNRWFSAIMNKQEVNVVVESHNPYFNRWFSAIK